MSSIIHHHPLLGDIKGVLVHEELIQYRSIRYAFIPKRFARSKLFKDTNIELDATEVGPSSIQPFDSPKTDADMNQLPINNENQIQSEDCLRVTITSPTKIAQNLPVVVFLHGGAFFVGSGERTCYSPINFCLEAIKMKKPLVFVSMNYRLGSLGFLHSPNLPEVMPPNNALHDQLRCFEWIKENISGFGGDFTNVTAIGQSAGAESLALHNLSGTNVSLYRRSIILSGSPVCMPSKTPDQHQENFIKQAQKIGIVTHGKTTTSIADELMNVDVDKIRKVEVVGAPCSSSEVIPYEQPTIKMISTEMPSQVSWLESQIVSTCTYDGGISHNIISSNKKRSGHAKSFIKLARGKLKHPDVILGMYNLNENVEDKVALMRICQLESDVGFFGAAHGYINGTFKKTKSYFQIFDLKNPFEGHLPTNKYATHTFDIVALLGGCQKQLEDAKEFESSIRAVTEWRRKIINYICSGEAPCQEFEMNSALLVDSTGANSITKEMYAGANTRFGELLEYVEMEGERGFDVLWFDVFRPWLDEVEE
ncbi:hypothetical protein AKO1_001782 [Acrasis kona]|uniref:Carboxylesterase type B domain-containing protein n=1 Tax=Acrasis kona TaxID=1008807 RepID=A0AAW2ZA17_9EUKA